MTRATKVLTAVTLVASLASCTTYQGSRKVAKVGGWMMLGGAVATAVTVIAMEASDSGGPGWLPIIAIGAVPGAIGFNLTVAGLIGLAAHKPDASEQRVGQAHPNDAEPANARSTSATSSRGVDDPTAESAY